MGAPCPQRVTLSTFRESWLRAGCRHLLPDKKSKASPAPPPHQGQRCPSFSLCLLPALALGYPRGLRESKSKALSLLRRRIPPSPPHGASSLSAFTPAPLGIQDLGWALLDAPSRLPSPQQMAHKGFSLSSELVAIMCLLCFSQLPPVTPSAAWGSGLHAHRPQLSRGPRWKPGLLPWASALCRWPRPQGPRAADETVTSAPQRVWGRSATGL